MKYRTDIQILRGFAVTIVVLYHFGAPFFEFGFLGVDIFFVISGFLMAILCGKYSAREFFLKRARRLLPAYFTTIAIVLIASTILTLPPENIQTVESTIFALFFASNFGFWMQNSYFSKEAFVPLLHLWSLGVEIQFYLIAPLLYYLGKKWNWLAPAALAGSLFLCFLVLNVSPKTSFFLTPFRIWEFLLGWLAAYHFTNDGAAVELPRKIPFGFLSLLGLLLLVFVLPMKPDATSFLTGHPGVIALLVCFSTCAILIVGLPAFFTTSLLGKSLENLGNYSYSIYLAHFPVLVLVLYVPFSGTILTPSNSLDAMVSIVLIIFTSLVLYHGVEKGGRAFFSVKNAAIAILIISAATLPLNQWNLSRHPDTVRKIFAALSDRATYRCGKIFRILNPTASFCEITPSRSAPDNPIIILVGNSHADSIKTSFAEAASQMGYRTFFSVPNGPLLNEKFDHAWLLKTVDDLKPKAVFFHYSPNVSLRNTLTGLPEKIAKKGAESVLILPVPTYSKNIPKALYWNEKEKNQLPDLNIDDYYNINEDNISFVKSNKNDSFSVYDTGSIFCTPKCALTSKNGNPFYFDNGHLTLSGADFLRDYFVKILSNISDAASKPNS